ncbi:hypothetical protein [Microbacterium arborescens]
MFRSRRKRSNLDLSALAGASWPAAAKLIALWKKDPHRTPHEIRYVLTFLRARLEKFESESRDTVGIAALIAAAGALAIAVYVGEVTVLASASPPVDSADPIEMAKMAAERFSAAMQVVPPIGWAGLLPAIGIVGVLVWTYFVPTKRAASARELIEALERDLFEIER